jgi:hypothetical protein
MANSSVRLHGVRSLELVPRERIRQTDRFDDPAMPWYLGWQESLTLLALLVEAELQS